MAHDADARPSTLIAKGFDDAPVAVPVDGVGLQARHDSYIHNLESVVNGGTMGCGVVSIRVNRHFSRHGKLGPQEGREL